MTQVDLIVLSHNNWTTSRSFFMWLFEMSDFHDFRLIWIDNGSSDEHVDHLPLYVNGSHILLMNPGNLGVIGGRNKGYELSEENNPAPLLMFLDNDQFVQPGWFEQHKRFIDQGYDLVGVEAWQLDKNFFPIQKCQSAHQHFDYVGCGGMLMRREVPRAIGMFDDRYSPAYFEDPDLCYRAAKAGFKIGWNHRARINHVPHQTLGRTDWRPQFGASYKVFKDKWQGEKPLRMKMPIVGVGS